MKHFFGAVLCAVCCLSTATASSASASDSVAQELMQLNSTLQVATKNHDVATLERLISNDYELISSSGKVYDRTAFLADAADKSLTYEVNEPEDVAVRHYGDDCAIVTAVLHVRYRPASTVTEVRIRYADVWIRQNGQWRYVLGQASPMKKA